ncbi:MAG: hypothetical protein IT550_03400 [Novosphingobium sp.]|nr:hypothetical protein [Novosphingobium sp.]
MFESCWTLRPTAKAMTTPALRSEHGDCRNGFTKARLP